MRVRLFERTGSPYRSCLMLEPTTADKANMPAVPDTALPVSWRYVNGNTLVRLDVVKVGRVVRLLVWGSGDQWAHYTFAAGRRS